MLQTLTFLIFLSKGHAILWAKRDNRTSYKNYQLWHVDIKNMNLTSEFEKRLADKAGYINWTSYPKLNDIYAYLKRVTAADTKSCTLQSIGKTSQRKDIMMLKLSNGNSSNEAFLLESGMHGREWVAVLSLLYFIEHIAWNFTKQPDYIRNKDWYILPMVNPDGYEYSMTKDRFWRKNRRRFSGPCDGVDLNRNFAYNWGVRDSSKDMCAVTYCGPVAFSEQESKAIRDLVKGRHFTGYVAIHSYGSAVLFPWICDGTTTLHTGVHTRVAKEMVMAMRPIANEHFVAGRVGQLHLKRGSGYSLDWVYSQGVPHVYGVETRGAGSGLFTLEANQLLPAVREVTAGLKRMAEVIV